MPIDMKDARFTRWVKASVGLDAIEPPAMLVAQYLGRVDLMLISAVGSVRPGDPQFDVNMGSLAMDHAALSGLWVFGAYELLRTIDERFRKDPSLLDPQVGKSLGVAKRRFARVRIPLAKLEANSANRATDANYPGVGFNRHGEIAWRVSEKEFISRQELSDLMLGILEDISQSLVQSKE